MASEKDFRFWDRRQVGLDLTYPLIHGDGRSIGQFSSTLTPSGSAVFEGQHAYVPTINSGGKFQSGDNPTASYTFNNDVYECSWMLWFKFIAWEGGAAVLMFQTHGATHNVVKSAFFYSPVTMSYGSGQIYPQGSDNRGVFSVIYSTSGLSSWTHICITFKSLSAGGDGIRRAYLNGVLHASSTTNNVNAYGPISRDMSGPVTLFSYYNTTTGEVAGRMQFASIMFRQLSAADIYSIYKTQLGAFSKP